MTAIEKALDALSHWVPTTHQDELHRDYVHTILSTYPPDALMAWAEGWEVGAYAVVVGCKPIPECDAYVEVLRRRRQPPKTLPAPAVNEMVSKCLMALALIQESKTHAEAVGLAKDAALTGHMFVLPTRPEPERGWNEQVRCYPRKNEEPLYIGLLRAYPDRFAWEWKLTRAGQGTVSKGEVTGVDSKAAAMTACDRAFTDLTGVHP